jgi:Putative Ig domain
VLVKRLIFSALVLFLAFYIAACGGNSSKSSPGGGSKNPALTISAATLPAGYVGSNYTSTTLTASGGSGTGYTWSVSTGTSLPAGMTLSPAGVIAGKPTADGVANFGVKVTDSASATATTQLSMTVKPGVAITTAAALPDGYVGVSYSQTLAATGGTGTGFTWALASGASLPDGLTLTSAGVLSGKPAAAGAAGFSVIVTDSAQNTATTQFSAAIKTAIAVATPPALPTAFVGTYYAQQLLATGGSGAGYTWALSGQTAVRSNARRMTSTGLPGGLALSSDGWITGTPTATGSGTATVIVTDSVGNSASMAITLIISTEISITTPSSLPGGNPGDIYSQKFTAAGGSGTYTWVSDDLPGGLRLSTDGELTGSLPAANTYTFTVTVIDSEDNSATGTFTITVGNALRFATPSTLIAAYMDMNYSATIRARGGSGQGYAFTVSAGSTLPAGLALSGGGVLSGKPTAAGTYSFGITVTDSDSSTAARTFSLTVKPGVSITSPSTLPAATVATAYSQSLAVTGGSGSGYIWTLTSGAPSLSAVGLSFSNGTVSGTPTALGTATFSVSVVDDSLTHAGGTFSVAVNASGAGFPVSGQITLGNACGVPSIPAITLSIDTNPAKTVTSDSSGIYSFADVPPGSYTIAPSIAGANSIFYPSSLPVTVSGGAVADQNFVASLAYKVSGTVSHSGSQSGQIYIWMLNENCGGNLLETSITAPGSFTIEGVPPGTYMLGAGIDKLGFGYLNDVDAAGLASPDVTVSDADVAGTTITMTDPLQSAPPPRAPRIIAINGNASGAMINFQPIVSPDPLFNRIELATAYVVQWSTDPAFGLVNGSLEFKAGGSNGTGVLILNDSHLASGNTYYFRMLGTNTFGTGTWSDIYSEDGINPTGVTIEDPAGNAVSGTVTFDATPTGPLYVGYADLQTGKAYSTRIQSPVSPQPFSVKVPTGPAYFHFAILDQNNDGMIDPGDVSNVHADELTPVAVSGAMTDQDLTLDAPASEATLTTRHIKSTYENGTSSETYSLNFQVKEGNKLPVAVRLMSGPHVLHPVDLGRCRECGNNQFVYNVETYSDLPAAGDSYDLLVNYSDGTSETLTAQVTGMVDAFATDLSPSATSDTSLTPTFTWTDPANPGDYQYQFYLTDSQGNMIWQIPGNNSNSGGFASTITSIVWGTDPTGANNDPSMSALTHGVTYTWNIRVIDANGNSSEQRTYYKP